MQSPDGTFQNSQLRASIEQNALRFLRRRLSISSSEAKTLFDCATRLGNPSLLFERSYGIDRYEWFASVWDLQPRHLITPPGPNLYQALAPLTGRTAILTSGPYVWAMPVLRYLGIADVFGDHVITGEPDIRKPDPLVFLQAAERLRRHPRYVVSVGDQNQSDIVPAKKLGMRTIIVGLDIGDADYRARNIFEAIDLL